MTHRASQIVVTGPESTGKSTLSQNLATHFKAPRVGEYARAFLAGLDRPYREEDLLSIAKGQWDRQREVLSRCQGPVFCDTGFLVMKVWSEFVFGRCHAWIEEMFLRQPPALYLLCDIDLPWESDPLREHPHHREILLTIYRKELESHGMPWEWVRGTEPGKRLHMAIGAVERQLGSPEAL